MTSTYCSQQSPTNERTTHTWNDENRQTKLEVPGGAVTTYTYRWDGLRYAKITASATRRFVYDGQNYLLETDGSNVVQAVMTNEPMAYGNLVSQRIRLAGTTWAPVYYHYDALGSTRQLTNNSATVANTYIYNAWGQTISSSEAIFNQFLWVGELGYYQDEESDDYYVRARYYDLATGRWISQDMLDVIVDSGRGTEKLDLYLYVHNNPLTLTDPSGLAWWWPFGGGKPKPKPGGFKLNRCLKLCDGLDLQTPAQAAACAALCKVFRKCTCDQLWKYCVAARKAGKARTREICALIYAKLCPKSDHGRFI